MSTPTNDRAGEYRDDDTVRMPRAEQTSAAPAGDQWEPERHTVLEQERDVFGGIKWGAAFFGWLTAAGAVVLLAAIVAGVGAIVDQTTSTDLQQVAQDPQSAGIVGGVVVVLVLLIGYFCGGYVAGRMARFDGARQGIAVWIWTLVMTAVLTGLGFAVGDQLDVTSGLSGVPTVPIDAGDRTWSAVIGGVAVLLVALLGAVLGGAAGMRFHRKVDTAGLGR